MFRCVLKSIKVYIFIVILFTFLIILVNLIPSTLLRANVGSSIYTFKQEGIYPSYGLPWRQIVLDNFTDSLMLNTAYSVDSSKPVWSALTNQRYELPGNTNEISNLETLYSTDATAQTGYERYWHGYLLYLRPLLIYFSYSTIRIIMTLLLLISFIWFIYLSWIKLGKKMAIFFIIGLISIDYFYLGQSIQFSGVFIISIFSSIYLLQRHKFENKHYLLFFIVGGLTSYIDLLTAPIVTLGILLIISAKFGNKKVIEIILYCLAWSLGYLSLWASKWLIVQLLFVPNAITTSYDQIINRTVNKADPNFSHFNAIKLNVLQLIGYNHFDKIIILIVASIFFIFWLKYFSITKQKIKNIIPWILIGVIPYIWYFIVANHSYLHVWFTYRDQFISVVCLLLIISEFMDWKKVNKDLFVILKTSALFFKFASKHSKH